MSDPKPLHHKYNTAHSRNEELGRGILLKEGAASGSEQAKCPLAH